jgi:peptidoglycan/xylan/chitin deacetylase (PgdA/CDA1 family)
VLCALAALAALAALTTGCGGGGRRAQATTAANPDAAVSAAAETPASPPTRPVSHLSSHAINNGPRGRRVVALTFDADMTRQMLSALQAGRVAAAYDPRIVAELRATSTPSTIFLTGLWTEHYAKVARSLARDPLFELENHTVDHAAFTGGCYGLPAVTDRGAQHAEIAGAARTIERITRHRPGFLRFPGGCFDRGAARLAASLGERPVQWDVASGDAFLRDSQEVVHNTLGQVKPGSIIVMHLNGAPNAPATAEALPGVIAGLRAKGLRPVTLAELVDGR